ncbi:MAG: helix-turn-helix transcriptional regulator [Rhodocyclaceae bacterium]|nr:helix-turn-helix transcriptional regulator [Rhodocyclaceae bacterium]MDZ4214613.1 helix-turn-helix transcriptional regulator [Rhodocyclaceae bacterium]
MEMKIDPQKIRQLREARSWSQEHLAEVAGLSARTVQRIEAEGNASPESRMAIAAALEVTAAELAPPCRRFPARLRRPATVRHRPPRRRHLVEMALARLGCRPAPALAAPAQSTGQPPRHLRRNMLQASHRLTKIHIVRIEGD